MSTDYSYLSLKICVADGEHDMTVHSVAGSFRFDNLPQNPENLFVNADEIYTFTSSEGCNVVTLWKFSENLPTVSASLAVKSGCKVKPLQIIRLLRECITLPELDAAELFGIFGFPPQAQTMPIPAPRKATVPIALRTFASTSALADIVSSRLSGHDGNVEELIAADATTVPAVDEKQLPRLRNNPVPDFEIETPVAPIVTPPAEATPAANVWEEEEEEYVARPPRKKRRNGPIFIVLAIVALAAGWAIVRYLPALLPESTQYDNIESTDVTELALMEQAAQQQQAAAPVDTVADTVAAAAQDTVAIPAPAPEQTVEKPAENADAAAEKADIEYLNSNRVWKRAELKSEKYRKFFDTFSTGSITDIVNSDYFVAAGVATNRNAVRVADYLWKAKGSDTQLSNTRALKKLKGKSEIDMHQLSESLAKIRPQKPNNSPRPKR